jgi:hypothetical protein
MAPETTFHHASVFPVTSSLWETVGGSPATLRRPLSPPPKGQKSRGPAWRLDATAITKLHRGNSSLSCSIQHFGIQSKSPGSACASSREALLAGMMPAERRLGPRLWKRNPGVEGAECQSAQCLTQFFSARPAKTRPARPDSTTESIRHDAPPPDLSFRFSGSMSRGAVRRGGRWLRSVRLLVLDRWRFTDQDTTSRLSRCRDVTSRIAIVGSAESWGASGPTGV